VDERNEPDLALQPRRERRRRRLLALLLVSTIGTVGAGAFSIAIFTDSQAVGANAFTTGTITLGLAPASALLTSSAMMPGDTVNGSLVVSNTGTGQLRYAMTRSRSRRWARAARRSMGPRSTTLL